MATFIDSDKCRKPGVEPGNHQSNSKRKEGLIRCLGKDGSKSIGFPERNILALFDLQRDVGRKRRKKKRTWSRTFKRVFEKEMLWLKHAKWCVLPLSLSIIPDIGGGKKRGKPGK